MLEFQHWLMENMPSIGMAAWLVLTAYVCYAQFLWRRALKKMDKDEDSN